MATSMGPPPSRNPNRINSDPVPSSELENRTADEPSTSESIKICMGPPQPKNPQENSFQSQSTGAEEPQPNHLPNESEATEIPAGAFTGKSSTLSKQEECQSIAAPYAIPSWSEPPCYRYFLEVLKGGSIIDQLYVHEKGAYMFGRVDLCDFMLEHPTISRFHAVLQFKQSGDAYIYDLGSTHGTFVNKNQVKKKFYVELHVGDVIRFGQSTRLYIFQGPTELMLPESDLKSIKRVRIREEMQDMEASLLRAKLEASLADGISWGMREDAIEEAEDDVEEITWQTYKGQLTDKQEKTRDKILKRLEKVANMKKEINAIRAKDISQGGLTQGQQTQIARNEQRMLQITEELENLEETLNESIRESLGARSGRSTQRKKTGAVQDDEDDCLSDEDEFYDRTKKKSSSRKGGENLSIETADTLLDKKDALVRDIEEKNKLLLEERDNVASGNVFTEAGDALDAYMSGLSSQLVLDKTEQLQKELSALQSEWDRILYLLKIADPTGEAAKRRASTSQEPNACLSKTLKSATVKHTPSEANKRTASEKSAGASTQEGTTNVTSESSKKPDLDEVIADVKESKNAAYTITKPQWLGAVGDVGKKEPEKEAPVDLRESDQFVDYKDRKKVLENLGAARTNDESGVEGIEGAAPGLIIRKRKQVEESTSSSVEAEIRAEDAVALLLKHKRGYHSLDNEAVQDADGMPSGIPSGKDNKKPKRVLGPERPQFLESGMDYESSWVPPEGQSGDGRTSLNDRYDY